MSKDPTMDNINSVFTNFDKAIDKLDKLYSKEVKKDTEEIMDMLFDQQILSKPKVFYQCVRRLSDTSGHVVQAVMLVEERREKMRAGVFETPFITTASVRRHDGAGSNPAPVTVQTATPTQEAPGFWAFMGTREQEKTKRMQFEESTRSVITSVEKPKDILDYCRDIPRESNKLVDWFEATLDHLHFFPDENTEYFFYTELRKHAAKFMSIVKSFTKAILEYRKELVGERQVAYAHALTLMEEAKYLSQAGYKGPSPFPDPMSDEMKSRMRRS